MVFMVLILRLDGSGISSGHSGLHFLERIGLVHQRSAHINE
jgi:hypothetical protein